MGHRTLPCRAPGSLHALSMACITILVTDVSPGPLQRLCLKRCPSKAACEASRRDHGLEVLGNRKEAYLDPCLEEELHRRLYTSRVGTRGPAPSSKTDLYGLDMASLQELCSAVAEHVKPIGPKAEGVLHFWTGPSALRWHVVTAIRNFPFLWLAMSGLLWVEPWPAPVLTFPPLHDRRLTLSDAGSQPKNCAGELTAAIYLDEAVLGLRTGTSD